MWSRKKHTVKSDIMIKTEHLSNSLLHWLLEVESSASEARLVGSLRLYHRCSTVRYGPVSVPVYDTKHNIIINMCTIMTCTKVTENNLPMQIKYDSAR